MPGSGRGRNQPTAASDGCQTPVSPILLKVTEVARLLQLSRLSVYGLMDNWLLYYVKIGSSRRVEMSAIKELIAAARIGG